MIPTNILSYVKVEAWRADALSVTLQPAWARQQGKGQFLPLARSGDST
jgi:hypothetical protein